MPRPALSAVDRRRGQLLGAELQRLRGTRTAAEVALKAGIPLDTLRKLEQGGVSSPGFFLVARLAEELGVPLGEIAIKVMTKGRRR